METVLEKKVQKLEDVLEIMNLQALYGSYLDKGYGGRTMDPKKAAEFYVADGTWECDAAGIVAKGREEIAGVFEQLDKTGAFYMHVFATPIINVNENDAYAEWLILIAQVDSGKIVMNYANEKINYLKTKDGWRLKTNKFSMPILPAA